MSAGVPAGHRAHVPPPGAPIDWPADFGRRFTIFVDVEEEFDWHASFDRAQRATTAMRAFPAAHARFAAMGVGLTCMVDHPVATDPAAVDMLRRVAADPRSALGAQLHAWVNPPYRDAPTAFTSYAGNLPVAVEKAKIRALTEAIATAFGERPMAFRSGRYGIGPNTLGLLAAAGYRVDTSVRPGYDYTSDGGPDFGHATNSAYVRDGIVELPLTTLFPGMVGPTGASLYRRLGAAPRLRGIAARLGLVSRIALTPEGMPVREVLKALDFAARTERLLVLSFHSPSLEPGHTPYVRDTADLTVFWRWWEMVLERLDRLGFRHASLAEILAAAT